MHQEWSKYLENICWKHGDIVRQLWLQLINLIPSLRLPHAGLSPDETSFFFIWDNGINYLEIEIFPNSELEWFYRNRADETLAGSQEPIVIISDELLDYLKRYAI